MEGIKEGVLLNSLYGTCLFICFIWGKKETSYKKISFYWTDRKIEANIAWEDFFFQFVLVCVRLFQFSDPVTGNKACKLETKYQIFHSINFDLSDVKKSDSFHEQQGC